MVKKEKLRKEKEESKKWSKNKSKKEIDKLSIFLNILTLIVAFVFFFSIGEIGVRLFKSDDLAPGLWPKENAKFVPELKRDLYVNLKNITKSTDEFSYTISTNQDGFRDFHSMEKKEGATRIVGIGSSSMFGNTVNSDQTYLSMLSSELSNLNVETINLGVGGTGFSEMRYIIEEYAFKYDPDLILVEVGFGNFYVSHLFEKKSSNPISSKSFIFWVYDNSKLVNHIYWKIKTTPLGQKFINLLKLNKHGQESNSFDISFLKGEKNPAIYESKKSAIKNFQAMKEISEKENVPIIMIFLPPPYQINTDKFDKIINEYKLERNIVDVTMAQEFYKTVINRLGLIFFDPTDDLSDHPEAKNLHWKFDGHFNERGNKIYSELLAEFIKENNILEVADK